MKSLSTFFEQLKQNAVICFRTKLTVNIVVQLKIERLVVSARPEGGRRTTICRIKDLIQCALSEIGSLLRKGRMNLHMRE